MKYALSILLTLSFLLQSFAAVNVVAKNKNRFTCEMNKETISSDIEQDSCCIQKVKSQKEKDQKDCCKGLGKACCCFPLIVMIEHDINDIVFYNDLETTKRYIYLDTKSQYNFNFFHPPMIG